MPLETSSGPPNPLEAEREGQAAAQEARDALTRVFDFPLSPLDDQSKFGYSAVWSGQLLRQVELSTHRFLSYLDSPDSIRNEEVAKFRREWMQRSLDLVPDPLLRRFSTEVKSVFQEVFAAYVRAMKQAILEYILRSPDERKRLHILVLPKARLPAALRHAKEGGFSVTKYAGHHQRRLEAEGRVKLGLITCNVATASLQAWWQDFQHHSLVELRNLGQFAVEKEPGKPGAALYALEVGQFFQFQAAYSRKVTELLRRVWHRGCVLIVKRYKWLRPRDQPRQLAQRDGPQSAGKWTFKGYRPARAEQTERRWLGDSVLRQVHEFACDADKTPLQAYYFRTASVHQNVHLSHFLNAAGQESTDSISEGDLHAELGLKELPDIRDTPAHRAYLRTIGRDLDLRLNGYKELDKEQRRELQYAAGNLMELQLRELVDRSVRTLRNFFAGFLTLEQLKAAAGGKPLRLVRPLVTVERAPVLELEEPRKKLTRAEQQEEAERLQNPAYRKQLAKRQQEQAQRREEAERWVGPEPALQHLAQLSTPDFMDYQDFVSPVFRLDLLLPRDDPAREGEGRAG